jgi:tRNA A64-2'-O-ribosylphosphate transferase
MANTSESLARAHIRRESLDVYNRLHSIQADIAFVNQVRVAYPSFPLIRTAHSLHLLSGFSCHLTNVSWTANLRCGAWYTDPAIVTFPLPHYDSLPSVKR